MNSPRAPDSIESVERVGATVAVVNHFAIGAHAPCRSLEHLKWQHHAAGSLLPESRGTRSLVPSCGLSSHERYSGYVASRLPRL